MNVDSNISNVKKSNKNVGQARITCPPTLAKNLDKLKVQFWVNWQDSSFIDELDSIKTSIQNTSNLTEKPYLCPGGFNWNVHRTGAGDFNFRLTSGDLFFFVNKRDSEDNRHNMSLEIGSESCWAPGYKEIFHRFTRWINVLGGEIIKNQVSEVHLALDLIDTPIASLNIENKQLWVTRSKTFKNIGSHRFLETFSIGKGDIMLRIYDKTLELKKSISKQLTFAEIWGFTDYNDKPVTRIEFQLRRPILKTIKEIESSLTGIDTYDDLNDSLQSIWNHCTHKWARHCSTIVDITNNHQSRATNSTFWDFVTNTTWDGSSIKTKQKPRPKKDIVSLRKQFRGIGMTLAAFYNAHPTDLDHIVDIGKNIFEEDLIEFYIDDEPEFIRRFQKKKQEIYESVSTLHTLIPDHPSTTTPLLNHEAFNE